jgi:hypothetical protein
MGTGTAQDVVRVDAPQKLSTMLAKSLVATALPGQRKPRQAKLPGTVLERPHVVVDPAHLAAYNEVCGFRLGNELPATYPHILAFPLQIQLMTQPTFPFPLIGLVHLRNVITQRRPMRVDEDFSLRVWVENLRPHDKGQQFDFVSEAVVPGEDEPVWRDVSTYLRRSGKKSDGKKETQLAPPAPKAIWRIPADIGRRYAAVSGDSNPIHLYPVTAKLLGFPKAIAHGMWTKAHSLAAFEGRLPEAFELDVRFKLPVLLPAKAAFTSWQLDDGFAFELWDARKPRPYLQGRITAK